MVNIGLEGLGGHRCAGGLLGVLHHGLQLAGASVRCACRHCGQHDLRLFYHHRSAPTTRSTAWQSTSLPRRSRPFIYRVYFGTGSDLKQIVTMSSVAIPGLKDIPVIGALLFDQSPMVYLTLLFVAFTAVFFARTRAGLSYKSVGEQPQAAATLGIHVIGVKYLACVICVGSVRYRRRVFRFLLLEHLHRRHCRGPRLHRAGGGDLRQMERGRHFAGMPVLRLLRRAADPSSGLRHRHPLSVLPDDSVSCHSSGPEPDRHEAGRSAGKRTALSPRTAVTR